MRILFPLALLLLATALCAPSAASEAYVTVTFRYGYGSDSEDNPSCALVVPAGADGVAVLQTAFAMHCVSQYATTDSGGGTRVKCLQGLCDTSLTGWRQHHDGAPATGGLEAFVAAEGKVLGLAYAPLPLPVGAP